MNPSPDIIEYCIYLILNPGCEMEIRGSFFYPFPDLFSALVDVEMTEEQIIDLLPINQYLNKDILQIIFGFLIHHFDSYRKFIKEVTARILQTMYSNHFIEDNQRSSYVCRFSPRQSFHIKHKFANTIIKRLMNDTPKENHSTKKILNKMLPHHNWYRMSQINQLISICILTHCTLPELFKNVECKGVLTYFRLLCFINPNQYFELLSSISSSNILNSL